MLTSAQRAAVHRMAGAFNRLSLAAELVALTPPGAARAAQVERMEAARKSALLDFAAAMDALSPPSAIPETSSADPVQPPGPPPPRAEQPPATSTTPRLTADAGGGRPAVHAPAPGTIRAMAVELAAQGPFYVGQLVARTGKPMATCRTVCGQLKDMGLLRYLPPPGGRSRGRSGQYAAALPVDEASYGVRRVPVEQARPSEPRREVPGVHRTPGAFFADKEPLPPARPVPPRFS